ncbi:MAG: hydrogenase nickel incorporation protein HypB [Propionibacteriaceae bacterium]|nr:hydrogenase nickel incorporation protein HypB [Propionibacteriaceae bacterium]
MGRFHRHDDGTAHSHGEHDLHHSHEHSHDHGPAHTHEHSHGDGDHTHEHNHDTHLEHLGDHSHYDTAGERVSVLEAIFEENDRAAARNRELLDAAHVRAINLMSSPGAGKTTLLAETLKVLKSQLRCGVIEGDIETSLDADRLTGFGAQISLLNTGHGFGGECHLDAPMVAQGLTGLNVDELDLVFIENVGNLVCPAEFDVGAHRRAMIISVTEGEDKPLKYPVMFRNVEAIVINKIDLLEYLYFDIDLLVANIHKINPQAIVIRTSATTGEGVSEWIDWVLAS